MTSLFIVVGTVSVLFRVHDWATAVPLVIIYAVLITNTFFSIRYFAPMETTGDRAQQGVDVLLTGLYIGMAFSFSDPRRFLVLVTAMFLVAVVKYILIQKQGTAFSVLARKIRVDAFGAIVCGLALVSIALFNHVRTTTWTPTAINAVANMYVLWWQPIYRDASEPARRS